MRGAAIGTTLVHAEPLSADEVLRVQLRVAAYCADPSPDAALVLGQGMPWVKAAFSALKALAMGTQVPGPKSADVTTATSKELTGCEAGLVVRKGSETVADPASSAAMEDMKSMGANDLSRDEEGAIDQTVELQGHRDLLRQVCKQT